MKQKIKIPINNVIIKKENIIEIAKFIFMQENRKDLIYRIKFKNEQEIESDDITIFEDRNEKDKILECCRLIKRHAELGWEGDDKGRCVAIDIDGKSPVFRDKAN